MNKVILVFFVLILTGTGCTLFTNKNNDAPLVNPNTTQTNIDKTDDQNTISFKVYFASTQNNENMEDCSKTDWVMRTVPKTDNLAQVALEQLFLGPTPSEKNIGLQEFWINKKLSSYFKRVFIKDDTAYIDWEDIREVIGNASTSCGQATFYNPIYNTLTQFSEIKNVVQAINGKTEVFQEWTQKGCAVGETTDRACDNNPYILNDKKIKLI